MPNPFLLRETVCVLAHMPLVELIAKKYTAVYEAVKISMQIPCALEVERPVSTLSCDSTQFR